MCTKGCTNIGRLKFLRHGKFFIRLANKKISFQYIKHFQFSHSEFTVRKTWRLTISSNFFFFIIGELPNRLSNSEYFNHVKRRFRWTI